MPTHSIDIRELIRKKRLEIRIEDQLAAHPCLIHPSLSLKIPHRQKQISRASRPDLYFEQGRLRIIVEIKRGKITPAAVEQILRYRRDLKIKHEYFRGYLIGRGILPEAQRKLKPYAPLLRFLNLGTDIPETIVICQTCRKARDARVSSCPHDGDTRTI